MEYFPRTKTLVETEDFVYKMQKQYQDYGYCYFAVDRLDNDVMIGFIGVARQTYEADFTPCVDIGWRLAQDQWGQGFATEGARACLRYAFLDLNMDHILSICPAINTKSERVMQKIGMQKVKEFDHILLKDTERLRRCKLYEINKSQYHHQNI